MKRATRNGLIAAAAASGALAVTFPAHADSAANGAATGSPGLISGNTVQIPVHIPVNVCGNTASVVGLLNAAKGNICANEGTHAAGSSSQGGASGGAVSDGSVSGGGASASGGAHGSSGVLSRNSVELPIHVPVNVSGNSVDVVGVGNSSADNTSTNTSSTHRPAPRPSVPATVHTPAAPAQPEIDPQPVAALAHTGADATLPALAGGAALVLGGGVLYRRFRPGSVR
ncbi:DUF320 domain-containing protein [Streptomyces sp. SID2888]|nr:chaplin [Streptomyces sp. SID2888]MYV44193.1 DUF320 domain-containing protein [Streptomyces sp. SID2888]